MCYTASRPFTCNSALVKIREEPCPSLQNPGIPLKMRSPPPKSEIQQILAKKLSSREKSLISGEMNNPPLTVRGGHILNVTQQFLKLHKYSIDKHDNKTV